MKTTRAGLLTVISVAAIFAAACSDDEAAKSAPDSGTDDTGGAGSGTGGRGTGGRATGSGGRSSGGAVGSTGGASTGGSAGAGGAATGGATGAGGTVGDASTDGPGTGGSSTGGGAGTGGTPADGGTEGGPSHKRLFLTSDIWNGDLRTHGAGATGLEGADNLCAAAAAAASLGGTWRAWLSDSTTNAIDRITDVGPWHLTDGQRVFDSKAALAGAPLVSIDKDENGATVTDFQTLHPWTGSLANGTKAPDTCADWTFGTDSSQTGQCGGGGGAGWSAFNAFGCGTPYGLLCFEQ